MLLKHNARAVGMHGVLHTTCDVLTCGWELLYPHAGLTCRASFDGKHPVRVQRGGAVHFRTSSCPLPLINMGSLDADFYEGITHKLKWNSAIRGAPPPRT